MRLAKDFGVLDWRTFGDDLPAEVFEGWKCYYQRDPWGWERLYEFLGRAFAMLAAAFHLPGYARQLIWTDFVWWVKPAERDEDQWNSDEDAERIIDSYHLRPTVISTVAVGQVVPDAISTTQNRQAQPDLLLVR